MLGAETARDAIHVPLSAGITTNAGYGELQSGLPGVIDGVDFHNSLSIRYDDNSRFGDKITWHVAPVLAIGGTGTRLNASYRHRLQSAVAGGSVRKLSRLLLFRQSQSQAGNQRRL